jgi:hypothetical protein
MHITHALVLYISFIDHNFLKIKINSLKFFNYSTNENLFFHFSKQYTILAKFVSSHIKYGCFN